MQSYIHNLQIQGTPEAINQKGRQLQWPEAKLLLQFQKTDKSSKPAEIVMKAEYQAVKLVLGRDQTI